MLKHQIAFASLRGMNMLVARNILDCLGSEQAFFETSSADLVKLLGIKNRMLETSVRAKALTDAENELEFIDKGRIETIYFTSDKYPANLLECSDAPLMLYSRGNADLNASKIISIVGTRNATPYGKSFTENMIADFASQLSGVLIVSGLAYGIDICAHRASLANGIPTVAVLGHGLNMIYPASHRSQAVKILDNGSLITDYTSQQGAHRSHFVARNRIVAGMAHATIVVESANRGGSLITAGIAESYGRDVFALPGRISDTYSQGCNHLIYRNKAALITSAQDVIDAMGWECNSSAPKQTELFTELTSEEERVYEYLKQNGEAQVNQMTVNLAIPMSQLLSILIELEFKSMIITYPGGKYRPLK